MKAFLRGWLGFVASLRALSVGLAYLKPDKLQEQVFAIAKGQSACGGGCVCLCVGLHCGGARCPPSHRGCPQSPSVRHRHPTGTELALRTFGIWTLLSGTVTVLCAVHIESGPLYRTTMASFAIALLYFALEVGVYKTVQPSAAISPGVIACESVSQPSLPLSLSLWLTTC